MLRPELPNPGPGHEIGHMVSGTSDGTLEFEQVLSELLGRVAETLLQT
jgi:hypothetical protein